jgi:hypothetical protein
MAINTEKLNATANGTKFKGFTPKPKSHPHDICETACPPQSPPQSTSTIPIERSDALTLSTQSHDAMKALQSSGLEDAAAYIQRKQAERNAIVEKVSDAIAYLSDPDILEADIMSAAAAKVSARSNAWGYTEPVVDFDNLFALPTSSQRLLEEAS